jgi:hypothetical protein
MRSHLSPGHPCCAALARDPVRKTTGVRIANGDPHRLSRSIVRRSLDFAGWLLPGATLVLLPKCPACLAAYIALGTGVGLSCPAATWLRVSLMILCLAALAYMAVRQACRSMAGLRRKAPVATG